MNGVTSSTNGKTNAERNAQRSYWTEHSVETTVEAMMLDSQAKVIDKEERPEVGVYGINLAGNIRSAVLVRVSGMS